MKFMVVSYARNWQHSATSLEVAREEARRWANSTGYPVWVRGPCIPDEEVLPSARVAEGPYHVRLSMCHTSRHHEYEFRTRAEAEDFARRVRSAHRETRPGEVSPHDRCGCRCDGAPHVWSLEEAAIAAPEIMGKGDLIHDVHVYPGHTCADYGDISRRGARYRVTYRGAVPVHEAVL